jgi:hypothetical protein
VRFSLVNVRIPNPTPTPSWRRGCSPHPSPHPRRPADRWAGQAGGYTEPGQVSRSGVSGPDPAAFRVNAIAGQMISHPKSVNDMYALLPEGKRAAIEARNDKAIGKNKEEE